MNYRSVLSHLKVAAARGKPSVNSFTATLIRLNHRRTQNRLFDQPLANRWQIHNRFVYNDNQVNWLLCSRGIRITRIALITAGEVSSV